MAIAPPLSTSWGYGIILGLGSLFALGMVSLGHFRCTSQYKLPNNIVRSLSHGS